MYTDRECPRCSENEGRRVVTRWSNEHDNGPVVACTACGITAASLLTPAEAARVAAIDAEPVKRRRRSYIAC